MTKPETTPRPTTAPSMRHDGYVRPHKALRLCMARHLAAVGSADPEDDDEVAVLLRGVHELLDFCSSHLEHEDRFIHPLLEQARPGSAAAADAEHRAHASAIEDLRDLCGLIADSAATARADALARLYRALALFVAENLEHMHHEETEHNAVLWAHYSDAELQATEQRMVAAIPPAVKAMSLRWFMPALNATERLAMLRQLQAGAPPAVLAQALESARQALPAPAHARLLAALGA